MSVESSTGRARGSALVAMLTLVLSAPPGAAQPLPQIQLEQVAAGLDNPVYVTHAGDDRLFVVEQPGRIRIVHDGRILNAPFLDIAGRVRWGGEQGLLGLAFHPDYRQNGRFFVHYTRQPEGAVVIAEYRVTENPDVADPSERVVLVVPHPLAWHNGGMIEFGPDRLLYIGMGDSGTPRFARRTDDLRGKILRIDVSGDPDEARPYRVPDDNPFAAGGGRGEIFAFGLRNPWRFSFDRDTGRLWAGDVGGDYQEEIDLVRRGGNYGWPTLEGTRCFARRECGTSGLDPPVATYSHTGGRCAVVGGYVYRGRNVPSLSGTYLYGDFCSGEIFGLLGSAPQTRLSTGLAIASFGEDRSGEIYVVSVKGTIHRVVGAPGERRSE